MIIAELCKAIAKIRYQTVMVAKCYISMSDLKMSNGNGRAKFLSLTKAVVSCAINKCCNIINKINAATILQVIAGLLQNARKYANAFLLQDYFIAHVRTAAIK